MTTEYQADSMLRKVEALLARAEHPNTPEPEADSCRQKAEAIIFKYKLDQAMLKDADRAPSYRLPMKKVIFVSDANNPWMQNQYSLAHRCFKHADCEVAYTWLRNPDDENRMWLALDVYGYQGDVLYGEMLFIACRITFLARLDPGVDRNLSDDENIYNLRHAGVERIRIANMLGWIDAVDIVSSRGRYKEADAVKKVNKATSRITAAIKRVCKAKGEDPALLLGQGNSMNSYRHSFAEGFLVTISLRLNRLRMQRGEDSRALVLVKRHEDVLELMYKDHPELRPQPAASTEWKRCEKCAQSKRGYCKEHKPIKYKTIPRNDAAYGRGSDAGLRVDLTGGNAPTGRAPGAPSHPGIER